MARAWPAIDMGDVWAVRDRVADFADYYYGVDQGDSVDWGAVDDFVSYLCSKLQIPTGEMGFCDTCGAGYDVADREGRCGDCGMCSDHCEHAGTS